MTPEHQIRQALTRLVDPSPSGVVDWRDEALAALDRLVAERDEARRELEEADREVGRLFSRKLAAEGREAALREAADRVVADKLIVDDGCDIAHLDSSIEALAAVLAAVPAADPRDESCTRCGATPETGQTDGCPECEGIVAAVPAADPAPPDEGLRATVDELRATVDDLARRARWRRWSET